MVKPVLLDDFRDAVRERLAIETGFDTTFTVVIGADAEKMLAFPAA
jgi:hypothetical protein